MELENGKSYFYDTIEELEQVICGETSTHGPDIVGQHFVCIVGDNDDTYSFVLDGAIGGRFTYKLIYNNE